MVYPRPRGEALVAQHVRESPPGLSPPTRGSRPMSGRSAGIPGSIPAHAGKPPSGITNILERRVYPRPRGEAMSARIAFVSPPGLSPPTRGSRDRPEAADAHLGSIPAHAGKPSVPPSPSLTCRVYPRPRGEAIGGYWDPDNRWGLSPPTRGSRVPNLNGVRDPGSIPAHAGKPASDSRCSAPTGVYPRPRGEAGRRGAVGDDAGGLSPPTRGSHCSPALL